VVCYTIRSWDSLAGQNRLVKHESVECKCHLVDKDIYIVPSASQRQLFRGEWILREYELADFLDGVIFAVAKNAQDRRQVCRECVGEIVLA